MRVVLWLLAIVVLAVAGAGAWLYFNSGALLKSAIEDYGSQAVGVPVKVGSVDLTLVESTGQINGLTVGNPPGFGNAPLMEIGLVRMGLNAEETSETLIVLKELTVDAATLNVVAKGRNTNLEALQKRIAAASGSSSDAEKAEVPRVIVDRLRLTKTKANVESDVLGNTTLAVPDVRLDKVGRAEGGITFEELADRIVSPITRDVTKELLNKGLGLDKAKARVEEKLQSELDKGLKSLKDRLKLGD